MPNVISLDKPTHFPPDISRMHAVSIMHRDARLENMLILSKFPARASICDYGKAVEAETCTVTTIGPIWTLAPEIWTVSTNGPYAHKTDVWAYSYAIAEILGYSVPEYPGVDGFRGFNPSITTTVMQRSEGCCALTARMRSRMSLLSTWLLSF